jgi:hypothetical protein
MGIDKSLSDRYPSVIMNGTKYQYGHNPNPEFNYYLVENAHVAKDYWWFREKEDLVAFLVMLPESADRGRRLRLHPDWHDVTDERRTAYIEEDRLALRAKAQKKIETGNAQSFSMDLDGKEGPHSPQRIDPNPRQQPLERVEQQLRDHKAYRMQGLNDAGKLRVIEGEIEWTGIAFRDKEAILAREVNFAAITPEQFRFVYEDIAFDKMEPADPAVAEVLFHRSRVQAGLQPVRDTTRNLIEAIGLDTWPRSGAIVDFGLKSQEHYEALYYTVRNGEITPEQLDAALGKGAELTALARSARSNPHRDIEFSTDWDVLLTQPEPDAGGPAGTPPSPSEIASQARQPAGERRDGQEKAPEREKDKDRER